MKNIAHVILASLLQLLAYSAFAQAPNWSAARIVVAFPNRASATYDPTVSATAADAFGNVYMAGQFAGTVTIGSTTITSVGIIDAFVAKFNPATNQFVWIKTAGEAGGTTFPSALAVSGTNVYVAGDFGTTTSFDGINLISAGYDDVFVAKLVDAGSTASFVWVQRAGGTGRDYANSLSVAGMGVYIAGSFADNSNFTASFGSFTLNSAGQNDAYVAKLVDAGASASFAWAKQMGGANGDAASSVWVSGTNVYVAGSFSSISVGFGSTTLVNAGANDVFVAKLTDAGNVGNFLWAQRAGDASNDYAYAMVVNGTSVYVAGSFSGLQSRFGSTSLTARGGPNVFVTKLIDAGSSGAFAWAQSCGSNSWAEGFALAVSGANVYVAGTFDSNFPGATFGNSTLVSTSTDAFVAKLVDAGSTGSFVWGQRAGGASVDRANAVTLSGPNVYVAGDFVSNTISFGSITLTNPVTNYYAGFLASLTDPTLTATMAAIPREPASLFPNPARRTATLRLPAGTAPAPLTLTDGVGRTVRSFPAPTGVEATLDLRGLSAGLYLLRGAGPARRLVIE
ncbi:T9SS type A sorting domain-containing protein [Hymenobacter sp. 5317J-9]|uniref:T9SS type A sorting domain-containing protein n=1 Tax=Hymenobacter sp. 5317J-9 TaxID=2932250 RepID=UPI001FD69BE9|nr:T9SS type A sorting domain-containing protein [Hymenobacter sp. 5317J-9]UOQ99319.1 T9SS type A sorting domain-containing protein [Hymenobacter sp. 5317J-9]